MKNDFLDTVTLRNFVNASFQVHLGFLVVNWLNFVLTHHLVVAAKRDDSSVVDCEFYLLQVGRVR